MNRHCYSGKGKSGAEDDSEINRAATPTTGRGKAASSKGGPASLVSVGQDDPTQCLKGGAKAASNLGRTT